MSSDQVIAAIDAAVQANLCGCGCGQQIPDRGPSPDFVNEKHQQVWAARGYRASGGRIAADWYERLRQTTDDLIDESWRTAPAPTVRRGGIRFNTMFHDDGSDCTPRHPVHQTPDESPMARVVRETSTLRKAIDKIRGIRP